MRAYNRIQRPYSRSWESRTRCGVKLDAIPNAHDHIAMYKEWAWTSLLISCANNRFVRWEFITGAPARSHLFDAVRRLVREPCGRARRRARSRDVLKSAPPENRAPRP